MGGPEDDGIALVLQSSFSAFLSPPLPRTPRTRIAAKGMTPSSHLHAMAVPTLSVHLAWHNGAPSDPTVRRRIAEEISAISWTLSQMDQLLWDAHQAAGAEHGFLLPKLELRLPLYDLKLRYRLVHTWLDDSRIELVDEEGRKIADIRLP
jgi:hypothetical protein